MKSLKQEVRRIKTCALRGVGKKRRFVEVITPARKGVKAVFGKSCLGLTKRLARNIFSKGNLPTITRRGDGSKFCGRKRGKLVDAQIGAIANGRKVPSNPYKLTQLLVAYFKKHNFQLLASQVPAMWRSRRLATAADLVAIKGDELIVVELKSGHMTGRDAAATLKKKVQTLRGPLKKATDTTLHRHFSQLSATIAMLNSSLGPIATRHGFTVGGMLLYANAEGITSYALPKWWQKRGLAICDAC
jgi:hypothetical protein